MAIRRIIPEIENAAGFCHSGKIIGGIAVPGGIRTHDLPLRRRTLYPAELQKHNQMALTYQRHFRQKSSYYNYSLFASHPLTEISFGRSLRCLGFSVYN